MRTVTSDQCVCVFSSLRVLCTVISVDNRSSTIEYTVRDLLPGRAYQFTVTAVNEAGEGSPSEPSSVLVIPEECLYLFLFDFITHIHIMMTLILQILFTLYIV